MKFKLAIFDLDGTLTKERSLWEFIHKSIGKWYGFAEEYQTQFFNNEISYEEFCRLDAQVWKGMSIKELKTIVESVPLYEGIGLLTSHLKNRGIKLSLISSGLSVLSDMVKERYAFDYAIANDLLCNNGTLTGEVCINVNFDKKALWAERVMNKYKTKREEVIAIGDSPGDKELFEIAGFSVAFNPSSKELNSIADVIVSSDNISDIIPKLPF
ncbi:MAG: HAD family phosphatase [Thermodesulfobacteriota bacterium]